MLRSHVPLSQADEHRAIALHGRAPVTHAVPVLAGDAPRTEWLERRRQGVGASEVAVVLGISPYSSPFALWWQKAQGWGSVEKFNMRVGSLLEPIIADLFSEVKSDALLFRPHAALYAHPAMDWMLATPDYLAAFPDRPDLCVPVECKSDDGGKGWGPDGTDEVPAYHRMQAIAQAQVFGSPLAYVVRLAGKKKLTVHPIAVEGDSTEYLGWAERCGAFIRSIDTGVCPDVDAHEATTKALESLYANVNGDDKAFVDVELARDYVASLATVRAANMQHERVKNRIRYAAQNAGNVYVAIDGDEYHVATRRTYKREGYEVPSGVVDGLYPMTEREAQQIIAAYERHEQEQEVLRHGGA